MQGAFEQSALALRRIAALDYRCPYSSDGCTARPFTLGERGANLHKHLGECDWVPVICTGRDGRSRPVIDACDAGGKGSSVLQPLPAQHLGEW